ncbi:hypothetical protein ACFW04_013874 [Cataglyphis niger]
MYTFQHHEKFSVGYYMQCSYDETLFANRSYRGADCIAWFADELEKLAHCIKNIISTNVPITLSHEQWETFRSATHCHIWEKPFAPDDTRVCPAHSNCNLNYKDFFYIPIVFHNLSGYDSHFIIKKIAIVQREN